MDGALAPFSPEVSEGSDGSGLTRPLESTAICACLQQGNPSFDGLLQRIYYGIPKQKRYTREKTPGGSSKSTDIAGHSAVLELHSD